MTMHIETFAKSLKGQGKIKELKHALSKAKLNNEKVASERDQLKYDLNARNKENARLTEDLITEKRSNVSKDSKIAELSHELEKIKSDADKHTRSEKKIVKSRCHLNMHRVIPRKASRHGLSVDMDSLREQRES